MRAFFLLVLFCFALSPCLYGQTVGHSHEECIKLVPGNWGPNFGEEWHQRETVYWGCRLGTSAETIRVWQQAANVSGMTQDIIPTTIEKQEIVLIEQMEGTMRCYDFLALKKTAKGWEQIWSLGGDEYCTAPCPPVRMKTFGAYLTLESPIASDDKCQHVSWRKEQFLWNGKTFVPTKPDSAVK